MKIYLIKVLKSKSPYYWYKSQIGKEFTAAHTGRIGFTYQLVNEGIFDKEPTAAYFDGEDVEILEKFDGKIRVETHVWVERYENA